MEKLNLTMLIIGLLFCISCQDAEMAIGDNGQECGSSSKAVKKVKNQRGILSYNDMEKMYTISVGVPQTYDSVDIGLLCNLPEEYKIESKEGEITWVIFSGKYRESEKTAPIGGATYYNLELSKLMLEEN